MLSLVIPVYKNEANLDRLLAALAGLNEQLPELEVVFVVDGSPDRSFEILSERLHTVPFRSRLVTLSRNFGSFCAIAAGLQAGSGDSFAVLAADLQEPPELILRFSEILRSGRADIVFGYRVARADPWLSEFFSDLFWRIYRGFVVKDMPKGGVDVFACTRQVRDRLLELKEVNTNLIALLFWLGFRREFVGYERQPRLEGESAWTLSKKIRYCLDSVFSFTDLPIRLLLYAGIGGIAFSVFCSGVVLGARFFGKVRIPGYTPIVLAILFFGALTSLGLGIVGQYLWLTLQSSRKRPGYVIAGSREYPSNPGAGLIAPRDMAAEVPERARTASASGEAGGQE